MPLGRRGPWTRRSRKRSCTWKRGEGTHALFWGFSVTSDWTFGEGRGESPPAALALQYTPPGNELVPTPCVTPSRAPPGPADAGQPQARAGPRRLRLTPEGPPHRQDCELCLRSAAAVFTAQSRGRASAVLLSEEPREAGKELRERSDLSSGRCTRQRTH